MAILRFLFYALKPLSKTADIWDFKDMLQAVLILLGYGGQVVVWTMNVDLAKGLLAVVPALLFLIAGVKLQLRVNRYEQAPRPYVKYVRYDEESPGQAKDPIFIRVWVRNQPPEGKLGDDAVDLRAEIRFSDSDGQEEFKMEGRWAGSAEAINGVDPRESELIHLPSNGREEPIDIALKYIGEEDAYGFDNLTQVKGIPGWRDPKKRLAKGLHYVTVQLRDRADVNTTCRFELNNEGRGKKLKFAPTDQPMFSASDVPAGASR